MIKKITIFKKQKTLLSILFILCWIFLLSSINTIPNDITNFGKSFTESINAIRIFVALTLSILLILFFFFIFFTKQIKVKKINIFFFIFFLSQALGVYLNKERSFDFHNLYLVILAIGVICLIIIIDYFKINYIIKYFFLITLFVFLITLIFFISLKFSEINKYNFYIAFENHETNSFNQVNPRITGLSRMLAIINLFLILHFFILKNYYLKNFTIFLTTILSLLLILMQSRGTLICFYISLSYIILFTLNKNIILKIKYFLVLIILPFILYFSINNVAYHIKKQETEKKIINSNNRILSFSSSGRYEIYSYTFKNYDYKKIFGYGSNGDRFFLENFNKKNIYGNNISNIFLFSLVSGGYLSVICIILIFYEIFKIIFQNQKKKIIINCVYMNFSIACLVYFFVRSFFENSFGLFSLDFLITYLSITYVKNFTNISKI